jgi:DnaJ-class molecular chaperone
MFSKILAEDANMSQIEKCTGCHGMKTIPCPVCDGRGSVSKKGTFWGEFGFGEKIECQSCLGTGKLLCPLCGGVGKIRTDKPKTGWL